MRKRVVGGGVIVGVLAFAWWWNGLGPGAGPGEGPGDGSGQHDAAESQSSDSDSDDAGETDLNGERQNSPSPGHGDRLTVLIRGDAYAIARGEEYVPATLDEIIDLAKRMPGDNVGIRVRIQHDSTGISGAQSDLERALGEAGLTRDQWQTVQQPVE